MKTFVELLKFWGIVIVNFLLYVLLHNMFYAVGVIAKNHIIIHTIMSVFEIVFFLLAVFGCPIATIVGTIKILKRRDKI